MNDRELVYRMRTCAAAISATYGPPDTLAAGMLLRDAATLLVEAAEALEKPEPLGEPMTLLPAQNAPATPAAPSGAIWGGTLPPATPQPCPSCGDANSARTVRRDRSKFTLTCPVCSNTWEYAR